jgi:hypothetical protein
VEVGVSVEMVGAEGREPGDVIAAALAPDQAVLVASLLDALVVRGPAPGDPAGQEWRVAADTALAGLPQALPESASRARNMCNE